MYNVYNQRGFRCFLKNIMAFEFVMTLILQILRNILFIFFLQEKYFHISFL
jgi:hypothetical protein